ADVALSRAEVAEFEGILERTIRDFADEFRAGFIAESPAKLRRLARYFAAINGDGDFPPTTCNAPWVSTVVEADGTVRPCFFHRALGNAREQPLAAILNSAEAIAFRRGLDVRTDPICRPCLCTLRRGPTDRPGARSPSWPAPTTPSRRTTIVRSRATPGCAGSSGTTMRARSKPASMSLTLAAALVSTRSSWPNGALA